MYHTTALQKVKANRIKRLRSNQYVSRSNKTEILCANQSDSWIEIICCFPPPPKKPLSLLNILVRHYPKCGAELIP